MAEFHLRVKEKVTHVFLGKVILLLILGLGISFYTGQTSAENHQKGITLTKEKYLADYESYKKELVENRQHQDWLYTFLWINLLAVVFGLYEGIARVFAWLLGFFIPQK